MTERASAPARALGGLTRRRRPAAGLRPTVLFPIAGSLTLAWVGFAVWASGPWRGELDAALGPVAGWVIPILLAYVPALVIGFMLFTLLVDPYRELELVPPAGSWPAGRWPDVTVLIAALNEADAIDTTLERVAGLTYSGSIEVVLADNGSIDHTGELGDEAAKRLGLTYRRIVELEPGKHRALNTALETVTTPITITVDADTLLHRDSVTYLVARLMSAPQGQHVSACAGGLVAQNPLAGFVTRMQQWDYRLGINGVKRMQAS